MKVAGGIVGITRNQTEKTRFLLVASELARLKVESKHIAIFTISLKQSITNRTRPFLSALSLSTTLQGFTNPFEHEGNDIINIVTKAVVHGNVQIDLAKIEKVGTETLNDFLESKLKTRCINVWDQMKRSHFKWKTSLKDRAA